MLSSHPQMIEWCLLLMVRRSLLRLTNLFLSPPPSKMPGSGTCLSLLSISNPSQTLARKLSMVPLHRLPILTQKLFFVFTFSLVFILMFVYLIIALLLLFKLNIWEDWQSLNAKSLLQLCGFTFVESTVMCSIWDKQTNKCLVNV